MRARCPFCLKRTPRVIVQFEFKPHVQVCYSCERVTKVDAYDSPEAHALVAKGRDSPEAHALGCVLPCVSREDYVSEVEDLLIMTSFIKEVIPRRGSI